MKRNDLFPNDAAAITPSDTAWLSLVGLMVTVAGNVAVTTGAGNAVTIPVAVGQVLELAITQVKATGTTATGIIGFKA